MKGIILAGGEGKRLRPLTKITSKQLLPVYDKPMVFYPLETLLRGGIRDILFIIAPDHAGDFLKLLGSGKEFGAKFSYEIQDKPEGLAQAFIIGEDFIGEDNVTMILGDNIFLAEGESASGGEDPLAHAIRSFKSGGHIFAKEVPDPERFGVVKFDSENRAVKIEEKPKEYLSNYAITGLYIFDNRVVEVAKKVKPSARGEFEITDLHNWYLQKNELVVDIVRGAWFDAGTFDTLLAASNLIAKKSQK